MERLEACEVDSGVCGVSPAVPGARTASSTLEPRGGGAESAAAAAQTAGRVVTHSPFTSINQNCVDVAASQAGLAAAGRLVLNGDVNAVECMGWGHA